jgi:hypothetical protein
MEVLGAKMSYKSKYNIVIQPGFKTCIVDLDQRVKLIELNRNRPYSRLVSP